MNIFDKIIKESATEFIIHVKDEYDYIFDSVYQKAIFLALKQAYYQNTGKNLPIYIVPNNMKYDGLHTTKKDAEEGRDVGLNDMYRDY